METKNNVVALLQPLTPKENFPADRGSGPEEDAAFKTILDEATRKTQRVPEQASAHQKNEPPSARLDNEQASASPSGSSTPDVKNDPAQGSGDGEPVESETTVLAPNTGPANGGNPDSPETTVNATATAKALMAERLKALGVDQEKIDAFLRLLAVDENDISGQETLLQLGAPLNAFQNNSQNKYTSATVDPQAASADATVNLRAISADATARDQLVTDFLRKAGVDEVHIKNFLQKLSQPKANETGAKTTLAELTPPDTAAENKSRSAFSKAEELNLSAPAPSAQKTSVSSKTDFQDPLSKALNSSQLRQASGNEGQAVTPMPNPQDSLRGAFTPDQGIRVSSADFLPQNSVQPTVNLASRVEGTQPPAQEVALPKGIPERALVDQIVQKISIHRNGNQSEARIRLDPPSLGTIRMIISTSNDTVKATLIAENHAVGQTLNNNLAQLKHSIEGQGLKVDHFAVLVGGDAGFDNQNNQNDPRSGAGTFGAPSPEGRSTLETAEQAAPAGTPLLKGIEGNINVFA